jgi:hypothetical protein
VNTASAGGIIGLPGYSGYASSKHASSASLTCCSRSGREERARQRRLPAAIPIPVLESLPAEEQEPLLALQAIKRFGNLDEVTGEDSVMLSIRATSPSLNDSRTS